MIAIHESYAGWSEQLRHRASTEHAKTLNRLTMFMVGVANTLLLCKSIQPSVNIALFSPGKGGGVAC